MSSGNLWGDNDVFDSALMGILQQCGKIQPFLEVLFSFLSRRTDFYIIMETETAKMGFPNGVALNMVMQAFKKFEILTRKREAELMREAETRRIDLMTDDMEPSPKLDIPTTAEEHIRQLTKVSPGSKSSTSSASKATQALPEASSTTQERSSQPTASSKPASSSEASDTKAAGSPSSPPKGASGGKDSVSLSSDTYNGAQTESYTWSQTITDLDIRAPIPPGVTAKDVSVVIAKDHLKVELIKPNKKVLVEGPLLNRVKVEDSMWSVDKASQHIFINLEKQKETMWKSVFQGEEGIDLTKVDTTRDISEFDQEAQAAIQRVTFDHQMKMMGKPTSSEQKAHDILRKAWDAPGSPFKGTPFDPTRVNIAGVW